MGGSTARSRDLKLALVLNGGVSLAIWIGGVTAEIDAARRAPPATPDDGRGTRGLYAKLLDLLDEDVVVDVIGGASAGGINGVLLGAAIYNSAPLPNLREVWISLGDLRGLLRPASSPAPPSLMQGDAIVLPELRRQLKQLYAGSPAPPDQDLHLYFPATDLFGYPHVYSDSSGRAFAERDHRRVFTFTSAQDEAEQVGSDGAMRSTVWLGDPAAAELLARAGRASSSFPIAFEAHGLEYAESGADATQRWLVDGGILDNQPFSPVLNRVAIAPATRPLRRVVLYVVPYVTEPGAEEAPPPPDASALATVSAALNLPRDLPKLLGLERIAREYAEQSLAKVTRLEQRRVQTPEALAAVAEQLFPSYRKTRLSSSRCVFQAWAADHFEAGEGALGQNPAWDAQDVALAPVDPGAVAAEPEEALPWIPETRLWARRGAWRWGLSPAERAAAWILLTLSEARLPPEKEDARDRARLVASALVAEIRALKPQLVQAFRAQPPADPVARARKAYEEQQIVAGLQRVQARFVTLNNRINSLNQGLDPANRAATVQEALDVEIARNAFAIQEFAVPMPFEYLLASAGIENALGHASDSPATKLAGMKLAHFGGFLKRSWRANDWLWGRLDGVEHMLRALVDPARIFEYTPEITADLAGLALALEPGAPEAPEAKAELAAVCEREVLKLGQQPTADPAKDLADLLDHAIRLPPGSRVEAGRLATPFRRVLAARFQLRILADDLARVAETARDDVAAGTSRTASGVAWANRVTDAQDVPTRVALFKDMRVGEEKLADETSSRMLLGTGSHGLAVATSMLAGSRGGLPAGARASLGGLRKLTLALSYPIRLLADEPWLGTAVFALLVALVIWAAESDSVLLGAALPALALLAVVTGLGLLTIATSVFEESRVTLARALGFAVFLGAPLAFAVLARGGQWAWLPGPFWSGLQEQLDANIRPGAVSFAAALALVASGLAVLVLTTRWIRIDRRILLGLYRWTIVAALGSLAVGFVLHRIDEHRAGGQTGWAAIANERHGAVLVLVLLGVLVFAGLMAELVVPLVRSTWRKLKPSG